MVRIWIWVCLLACLFIELKGLCHNSSQFRYDLTEPAELVNYNSICFEHSKRTCCSPNNFQQLAKKIGKLLGPSMELSMTCRRKLTDIMCSRCDGDVGESFIEGVCPDYCNRLYQQCSKDLFAIDANNQLRVCREDDIICSPLSDILAEKGPDQLCDFLQQKKGRGNCWNGQVSAHIRGRPPRKIKLDPKKRPSAQPRKAKAQQPWMSTSVMTYLSLVVVLVLILLYRYLKLKRVQWKRQLRNL